MMGIKCISSPTITAIRDLAIVTRISCPSRSPVMIPLVVLMLALLGSHHQCNSHSVFIASGAGSDLVGADEPPYSNVLLNDVEELQPSCER